MTSSFLRTWLTGFHSSRGFIVKSDADLFFRFSVAFFSMSGPFPAPALISAVCFRQVRPAYLFSISYCLTLASSSSRSVFSHAFFGSGSMLKIGAEADDKFDTRFFRDDLKSSEKFRQIADRNIRMSENTVNKNRFDIIIGTHNSVDKSDIFIYVIDIFEIVHDDHADLVFEIMLDHGQLF